MKRYEITGTTNDGNLKTVSNISLLQLYEEAPWTEEEFESFCEMEVDEEVNVSHFTIKRTQ